MSHYAKRYPGGFVDVPSQTTLIDAAFLNAVESALTTLYGSDPGGSNYVPYWTGSTFAYQLLKAANIDPAAGITKSQLASLGIVNADVATGAAIDPAKIASGLLISQLSGYPADGTKVPKGDGTWGTVTVATQLDYAQITASSAAVTATTEGTATAIVTGNSVTYDGSAVMIEFFAPKMISSAANSGMFVLSRDSTVLSQVFTGNNSTGGLGAINIKMKDTPSAGAHTYKVSLFVASGSGSFTVNAGAGGSGNLAPAYLRVSRAA